MIGSNKPAILKKIEPTIKAYKSILPISSIASDTSLGKASNKPLDNYVCNLFVASKTAAL